MGRSTGFDAVLCYRFLRQHRAIWHICQSLHRAVKRRWVPRDRTAPAAQQSGLMESQHKGLGAFCHQPSPKHNFCLLESKTQTLACEVICKVRQIFQQRTEVILMFVFYISDIFYFNLQLKYITGVNTGESLQGTEEILKPPAFSKTVFVM